VLVPSFPPPSAGTCRTAAPHPVSGAQECAPRGRPILTLSREIFIRLGEHALCETFYWNAIMPPQHLLGGRTPLGKIERHRGRKKNDLLTRGPILLTYFVPHSKGMNAAHNLLERWTPPPDRTFLQTILEMEPHRKPFERSGTPFDALCLWVSCTWPLQWDGGLTGVAGVAVWGPERFVAQNGVALCLVHPDGQF